MGDLPLLAVHAIVWGRVQGVGFRYGAERAAVQCGVQGWVRNRHDGAVEVHCEGVAEKVTRYVQWLEKGPPGARVTKIEKRAVPPQNTYRSFTIEY